MYRTADNTSAALGDANELRLSQAQELSLDLIRICMAQLIVVDHLLRLSGNQSWVAKLPLAGLRVVVFFILSGFLVFATTWRRRHRSFTFRDYLIERSARLWTCLTPALIFSAVVAHQIIHLPDYPALHATGPVQFLGNLLMLEEYPLFQILRRLGLQSDFFIECYATAEPYWSLPVEFWLYVAFGYVFFFAYLQRGRPSWSATALFAVAAGAVTYHAATGTGDCLSVLWLLGCALTFAVPMERKLQARFRYSDRKAVLLVLAWIAFFCVMLGLRTLSRGVRFYELQTGSFVAALLLGIVWLTGRSEWSIAPWIAQGARSVAKQTYALYLTHNAVLSFYIAHRGRDLSLGEALGLLLLCNSVALPFYWFFDRHHKAVAARVKALFFRPTADPAAAVREPAE